MNYERSAVVTHNARAFNCEGTQICSFGPIDCTSVPVPTRPQSNKHVCCLDCIREQTRAWLQSASLCCLQAEWNFLLRGGSSQTPISSDAATPSWLSGSQWSQMVQMGRAVPPLQDVADSMSMPSESLAWEEWAGCTNPHLQPLPLAWQPVCTTFHRLLLLKVSAHPPRQHCMHPLPLTIPFTTC